jgi:hypothetical protein
VTFENTRDEDSAVRFAYDFMLQSGESRQGVHVNEDGTFGVDLASLIEEGSSCKVGLTSFMVPTCGEQ